MAAEAAQADMKLPPEQRKSSDAAAAFAASGLAQDVERAAAAPFVAHYPPMPPNVTVVHQSVYVQENNTTTINNSVDQSTTNNYVDASRNINTNVNQTNVLNQTAVFAAASVPLPKTPSKNAKKAISRKGFATKSKVKHSYKKIANAAHPSRVQPTEAPIPVAAPVSTRTREGSRKVRSEHADEGQSKYAKVQSE